MQKHLKLQSAKAEARSALTRHLKMLSDIREHSITANQSKSEFIYLMAIPIIYAAWEGFFRISCSICLRRICHRGRKSKRYNPKYSTLWLQKEPFINSFFDSILNNMQPGRAQTMTGGRFNALARLSDNLNRWHETPLDHLTDFDKLVMTHSNVNRDITQLNAEIIGIDLAGIDFSRIDELLNRRNQIAHGGIINYPREETVENLINYTERLINSFHTSVENWLSSSR